MKIVSIYIVIGYSLHSEDLFRHNHIRVLIIIFSRQSFWYRGTTIIKSTNLDNKDKCPPQDQHLNCFFFFSPQKLFGQLSENNCCFSNMCMEDNSLLNLIPRSCNNSDSGFVIFPRLVYSVVRDQRADNLHAVFFNTLAYCTELFVRLV